MTGNSSVWSRPLSRRAFGAAALAVGAGLAGCASTGTPAASPNASSGSTPSSAPASFPTTITHAFGQTVVEAQPTRVVSVGVTEHDFLLALGVVPVAVTDWYGDQPYATWPWA